MEDQLRKDRIFDVNERGEIILPIGHFTVVRTKSLKSIFPKIAINGLGSCIALILIDKVNQIYGMSHILLPSYNKLYNKTPLRYPHKYADIAVKDLIIQLEKEGADRQKLKAVIVGGSKIFQNHHNNIGKENGEMVKKELQKFNIDILKEDIGGIKGRSVSFNTKTISVFVRGSRQDKYKKIL
ncbi:MAG: chemotaxis protein CheD [Promethearchaeota archaeon]